MTEPIKLDGEDAAVQVGDAVYTSGDIENLKAGHDANRIKKEKLAEYEQRLEETKTKLEKLENKDYNFKKLRDMNDEEKAKLSNTELELKKKQEELEDNQTKFTQSIVDGNKNEALAVLVGDDKEMKKKVLYNYDRIKGEAITKEDINNRMREAFNMLGQTANSINPINQAVNFRGGGGVVSKNKIVIDPTLAKNFGITDEDIKKANLK